jgi:hypothetical protein
LIDTGAWLAPETDTAAWDVCVTLLDAMTPVAELFPEVAVVLPPEVAPPGGPTATLIPDWALAAPESWTLLEWVFSTDNAALPPPAFPALSWALLMLVCAEPARAVLEPLRALVAGPGVATTAAVPPPAAAAAAVFGAEPAAAAAVFGAEPAAAAAVLAVAAAVLGAVAAAVL